MPNTSAALATSTALSSSSTAPLAGEHEIGELTGWVDNTEPLYRQRLAIEAMLARKVAKGRFDAKRAPVAYAALMVTASQDYARNVGPLAATARERKAIREAAALEFAGQFAKSIRAACWGDFADDTAALLRTVPADVLASQGLA